jgi:hypothetical protein
VELSLKIPQDDFDVDSLSAAVARLAEMVQDHEHVRINVTTDFVEAVRKVIVDDPEYAMAYQQEREFAFAVAKTITQSDGSIDLIVDAGIFSHEAEPAQALHTFEHEALHIVVGGRGETMSDLRLRRKQPRGTAQGTYSAITGVACEEYRVERALWSMHPDSRDGLHLTDFHIVVDRFYESVRAASVQYQRDLDVEAIARSVMDAFHALCTSTAYVAAEMDVVPERRISVDPELDDRILGDAWRAAIRALQHLPPADAATAFDELEDLSEAVGERFEEWLEHIGFSLSDTEDGALHFAVLNPEDWVSWADL